MKILTKYHGEIEIKKSDIITFPNGIPGFIEEKKFTLLPLDGESPFWILQSVTTEGLGFVAVNPFSFFPTYEFDVSENDKQLIEIQSEKDVSIWSILTIKDPFEESTANLQAPIIVNTKRKIAKQIILVNTQYKTKEQLFPKTATK